MILELSLVDISIWWTIKLYRYPRCPKRILINRYVTSIFHFSISATAIIRTAIILDSQRKPFFVNRSKKLFYYRSHFTAHCSPQFILCRNQMRFNSFTITNSIHNFYVFYWLCRSIPFVTVCVILLYLSVQVIYWYSIICKEKPPFTFVINRRNFGDRNNWTVKYNRTNSVRKKFAII